MIAGIPNVYVSQFFNTPHLQHPSLSVDVGLPVVVRLSTCPGLIRYHRLVTCPRLSMFPTDLAPQIIYVPQIDYISRAIDVSHIFTAPALQYIPACQCVRRGSLIKRILRILIWSLLPSATLNFVAGGCSCFGRMFLSPEGEYVLVCHSCRRRPSSNPEGKIVGGGRFRQNPPALSVKHATIPPSQDKSTLPPRKHPSETKTRSLHMSALPRQIHPPAIYKPDLHHASPQVQTNGEYPCLVIEEKTLWTMPVTM